MRETKRKLLEVLIEAKRSWFHADTFYGLMSIRGIECNAEEGRADAFHARKMLL